MFDALRKALLAGLGTLDLTEEKAREIFDNLVQRGELSRQEAHELLSTWRSRMTAQQAKLQQQIDRGLQRALDSLELVRKADFVALEARVAALEHKSPEVPPVDPEC